MARLKRSSLLGTLLLACGTVRGNPGERDAWFAYVADGKRYGSLHVQVARLPDGNYRVIRHARLLLDVLGVNKEEVEEHGEYVVTPAYRPVAIEVKASQGSGKTRISGRVRGGTFEVSTSRAGIERSRAFGPTTDVLLRPCLEDWLADRRPGFEAGAVTFFDEEACELRPARVQRLVVPNAGPAWSVDLGPMEGKQRIVLSPDGLLLEVSSEDVGPNFRRCSAEEGRDIAYRKLDGREMLMFPLNKDVGSPERLTSLTVEIRWKDIPFDRFRLADDRQHVVERSEEGGRYRAVVQIDVPEPVTAAARLPVEGAEFAPFLGKSRFIEPHDPKIAELARQVVAGQGDALGAAKALSTWVSKNVEAAMIAETLSGPEVLACRKGKCSEYAILFASLARSAGIPTRIVLGERLNAGQWGGHMWNEAYVGRWIPVDASCDEVGSSFSLLKFVDHETVEGTQELRRKLPASLDLEIGEFRKQVSPLAGKFQTGIAGGVYTNADLGYRMTSPGDGWSIEEKSQPGAVVLRYQIPRKDDVQLHFVAFSLPAGIEPKTLLGIRLAAYKARLKGFEVITDEEYPVKGLAGRRVQFKYAKGNEKGRRATEVVWRTGSAGYLLALDAEESAFDDLKEGYTALLESFEDLNPK